MASKSDRTDTQKNSKKGSAKDASKVGAKAAAKTVEKITATRPELVKKFQTHETDVGSSEVQVALLTKTIEELVAHGKTHGKDHSARRGMMKKIESRKKHLAYLASTNPSSYQKVISELGLRK